MPEHTCNKGTAVVESLSAMLLITLIVLGILALAYFAFAKVTVSSVAYDSLICVAERQPQTVCEVQAKEALATRLPVGRLNYLKTNKHHSRFRVSASWTFFADHRVEYKKSLRY